ncbi:hypothetical protein [Thalassomonas haliotis]|uniref:Uncharacterized protein n=1 Tax=Thalassomonas haliotis TaxID=485448 RepID=A0ABY7VG81_9GAMM|nr:hypothetical protein [Thalassomonas haliotis]WDE12523.1 hypothetical protein H3N35_03300 [Thalassomonas haliotis]
MFDDIAAVRSGTRVLTAAEQAAGVRHMLLACEKGAKFFRYLALLFEDETAKTRLLILARQYKKIVALLHKYSALIAEQERQVRLMFELDFFSQELQQGVICRKSRRVFVLLIEHQQQNLQSLMRLGQSAASLALKKAYQHIITAYQGVINQLFTIEKNLPR